MTNEIDRLRRENRVLRAAAIFVGGAVTAIAGLGLSELDPAPRGNDPIGVATDGTYVYVLFHDGRINRMQIEDRERVNRLNPDFYHSNEPYKWNRFVESW